ncbi:MAG TPA: carboxypeptidase-like regulatory domain-containing protein [Desulfuromonadaceae bacterium]
MKRAVSFTLLVASLLVGPPLSRAVPLLVLEGRISDSDGKPVEGGEVFIYNSPKTRRPADFISPRSDSAGHYRTEIPAGRYWVVARVRDGAAYGPLAFGKRHSGEAQEIEGDAGSSVTADFTVADVREMARNRQKSGDDFRLVQGRILDGEGKPVRGAYAFARPEGVKTGLPLFVSPSSDEEGRYVLYIPPGRACVGAAVAFPPEEGALCTEIAAGAAANDVAKDLRLHYSGKSDMNGKQLETDVE